MRSLYVIAELHVTFNYITLTVQQRLYSKCM